MTHFPRATVLVLLLAANALAREPETRPSVPPPGAQEWLKFGNGVSLLLAPYMNAPGVLLPNATSYLIVCCYGTGIMHEPQGLAGITALIQKIRPAPGELPVGIEWQWMGFATPTQTFHFGVIPPRKFLEQEIAVENILMRAEGPRGYGATTIGHALSREELADEKEEQEIQTRQRGRNPHDDDPLSHLTGSKSVFPKALAAMAQAWNYGLRNVTFHESLDELPLAQVKAFYQQTYDPSNLTFVVLGAFDEQDVLGVVKRQLAAVPKRAARTTRSSTDFARLPREIFVKWNRSETVIGLAFLAPDNVRERLVLERWGSEFWRALAVKRAREHGTKPAAESALSIVTSLGLPIAPFGFPMGTGPFIVLAVGAKNTPAAEVRRAAESALLEAIGAEMTDQSVDTVRKSITHVLYEAKNLNYESYASGAVQFAYERITVGPGGENELKKLRNVSAEELKAILRKCLDPQRQIVTILEPAR